MKRHLTAEIKIVSSKVFDDFRSAMIEEFDDEKFLVFKRKVSQGAFWTMLDKDLANQYFRTEVWLFGVKISDQMKLIDHALDDNGFGKNSGMGFVAKK
jgi:hypothetical protein